MAIESAGRSPHADPQMTQSSLLSNNQVCMNNAVGALEGFGFSENVQRNRILPHSSPSLNLSRNKAINGGGQLHNDGSRKLSRDQMETLLGIDLSQQLNQLEEDSDLIVAQHMKKMKLEKNMFFKRQMTLITTSFIQKANERIKQMDAKLQEVNQMNEALREKIVALSTENKLWRKLAKDNEEIANTLRENLVQIIAHATITSEEGVPVSNGCNSYCDSNKIGGGNVVVNSTTFPASVGGRSGSGGACGSSGGMMCLRCGMMESSVLIMPCRHLSLCAACGTILPAACLVCGTECNGGIMVNLC